MAIIIAATLIDIQATEPVSLVTSIARARERPFVVGARGIGVARVGVAFINVSAYFTVPFKSFVAHASECASEVQTLCVSVAVVSIIALVMIQAHPSISLVTSIALALITSLRVRASGHLMAQMHSCCTFIYVIAHLAVSLVTDVAFAHERSSCIAARGVFRAGVF